MSLNSRYFTIRVYGVHHDNLYGVQTYAISGEHRA